MQIVVASNCHGSLPALESLLTEVERLKERGRDISRIYLLGIFGIFPYAREVYELLSSSKSSSERDADLINIITPIKGKHDRLIEKPERMEANDLPEFEKKALTFAHDALGHEGRKWLRTSVASSVAENFGDNRFYFTYSPASEDVLPKMPTSYYENMLLGLEKYDVVAVAGYQPFLVKTKYGKLVCPGSISIAAGRDAKPSFAVIDVETTAVEFFNLEYGKSEVERRVKDSGLPEEVIKVLYHGFM
jgi:hypothetical protein